MNETESKDAEAEIQLPKSHLALRNGVLEKSDEKGKIVARHPLHDIVAVRMIWKVETASVVMGTAGMALGYVAWSFIDSAGWKWAATICILLVALVFFLISNQQYIELDCGEDNVKYSVKDERDENDGFYVSLKRAVNLAKGAPTVSSPPASPVIAAQSSAETTNLDSRTPRL